MGTVHEQLSEQFFTFEKRGRGWEVFDEPVTPEPPFAPFKGYQLAQVIDDGRRPTVLSSFAGSLSRWLSKGSPAEIENADETISEPESTPLVREEELVELRTTLPSNLNTSPEAVKAFISNLSACVEPVALEIIGNSEAITLQFACHPRDASLVRRQLIAYFPESTFVPATGNLSAFEENEAFRAVVDFGLEREFLFPLAVGKIDAFIGIVGALTELLENEAALCQIIFERCRHPWGPSIMRSVTDGTGKSLFSNRPELVGLAKEKTSQPLYAVILRFAAKSDTFENAWEILRNMAGALHVFTNPNGNELIPLHNDQYPIENHIEDVLRRQTRRSGMLLNLDELLGLVHLPSLAVRSNKFKRQATNTKAAPRIVTGSKGAILGENCHVGETREVRLSPDQRTQHMHVIGASGTGKSTFLFNLIEQDIEAGEGVAVFDPHGDLIDRILGIIPEHRISDVVLIDPGDEEYSVGFNILTAHSDLEKTLLASDLVSIFQRLSTSWGDQMEGVLRNAILAFLESTRGGTLSDLRWFLLDSKFREDFLRTVTDPDIRLFWQKGFTQLSGNKSIGPVITRLETFLSPKPLRYMVAQRSNRLNFSEILDSGKIFLAKLSQGAIGKENSYLLGSLLMSKFQQTAMSRQRQAANVRRDFWLYVDEFHNFITPSIAEILNGARKYRVGLILAHQELRQLERDREVGSAVLSNPYSRVIFRVGDADARTLEHGLSTFTARDLQNLGTGDAVARVERSDFDFNLSIHPSVEKAPGEAADRRNQAIQASRALYATPRATIESQLLRQIPPPEKPVTVETKSSNEGSVPEPLQKEEAFLAIPAAAPLEARQDAQLLDNPQIQKIQSNEPKPPTDMGRGGEQHTAIQKRLKEAGERVGFLATTEFTLPNGSIDVAFTHSGKKIVAVEITITTTIDHEVGNVIKCIHADFPLVAVISSRETKLQQMKDAIVSAVGPEFSNRVVYFLPDAFIDHLKVLGKSFSLQTPEPLQAIRRGYKVRHSSPKLTPEELKVKEEAALRLLAETMKRKVAV
jgi:hypothetical protein